MNDTLHVATLNLRGIDDRIDARFPLVLSEMEALQPDILGLQECIFGLQQDRLVGAACLNHYEIRRAWALANSSMSPRVMPARPCGRWRRA